QAALGRAARQAVLHAEAGEDLGMAVLHARRHRDDHRPPRRVQPLEHTRIDVDVLGDGIELLTSHLEGGRVAVDGDRRMRTAIRIAVMVNDDLGRGHECLLYARERAARGGRDHPDARRLLLVSYLIDGKRDYAGCFGPESWKDGQAYHRLRLS